MSTQTIDPEEFWPDEQWPQKIEVASSDEFNPPHVVWLEGPLGPGTCDCKDFEYRQHNCRHIHEAVVISTADFDRRLGRGTRTAIKGGLKRKPRAKAESADTLRPESRNTPRPKVKRKRQVRRTRA